MTRRDILQMLHVKEEESSTAIHPSPPIKHTSNQERESERCHRSREGRGEVERKERRPTKKEKNTDREEEKSSIC